MSTLPCTSNFTYFDTPDFLLHALHVLTAISTPIYCLGVYCILLKTPEAMKSVKWYLFTLHFWILIFDYYVCLLTVPYLLIPEIAGIPYGVLRYLGVPTSFQTIAGVIVLAYMFTSNASIFENRFFILCQFPGKRFWASLRRAWLAYHYFIILVCFIPVFYLIPDQEEAKESVLKRLPCLPDYIYSAPVFVLATDFTYHILFSGGGIAALCSETGFFITMLIWNGRSQQKSKTISQKTYQMHKQFLIALVIQMSIPLVMLILPVMYGYVSILLTHWNQGAINGCVVIAMSHGFLSTVVMIVVHKPYRLAVKAMIMKGDEEIRMQRKSTVLSVQL